MNNYNYYTTGIKNTFARRKVIGILWIFNFVFALILIYPIYSELKSMMSHSLVNDLMLEQFSLLWVGDLIYSYQDWGGFLSATLMIPLFFYLALQVFFNGGIIASLNEEKTNINLQFFFSQSAKYFGSMLRLFLLSVPVYLLMFAIYSGIGKLLGLFVKSAANAWPGFIVANIKWVFFILLFSIFNMIFDYAKIRLVLSGSNKSWKSFTFGLGFVFRHFFGAWGLYLLNMLVFIIIAIIYMELEHVLPGNSLFFIIVVFILQQIFVAGRLFIRMNFFASQAELYRIRTKTSGL